MVEFFAQLFSSAGFEPHGHSFLWQPDILWLHVLSDLGMALAYYAILLALLYFVCKRADLAYKKIFVMLGGFIFFCGTMYLFNIWTIWHGTYRLEGLVKFVTAAISVATAMLLWRVIPAALRLLNPAQLVQTNQALQAELNARQQAEASLRASQEMFAQLFEFAPDALILANATGEIVMVNAQAECLFGYGRQELQGQPIECLLPERFHQAHRQHRQQFMAAPRVRPMGEGLALFGRRRDGQEFPVEISLSPLTMAQEQFVVSAIRDSTERQRLAETLRRTEHLALLGTLAAGVSHDLRNPLGSVALHVELVEEELRTPTPESAAEIGLSLATIKTEMVRIQDLVQDYLTLARLTTLQREVTNFGTFVADFVQEMQPLVTQRGVTLHWEGPTTLGPVALHANTFRRVLLNLVQNALDAMPQGGTLTLRGQQTASQVHLDISDTGTGIAAEQLRQIFEPLYTTRPGGTGLGLYLVREIMTAHGGTISVQSAVGRGTTCTLTLPLVSTAAPLG